MENDMINNPKHYTSDPSGIECIEITRHRNFNIGNAIKYLWRAGLKPSMNKDDTSAEIEDLNKAIWYLIDEINRLGGKCEVVTNAIDDTLINKISYKFPEKLNACYRPKRKCERSIGYSEFIHSNNQWYIIHTPINDVETIREIVKLLETLNLNK